MEKTDYNIRIEKYLLKIDRYSCILIGCMPDRAYQQTNEGQRVLIKASIMYKFEIVNPELLETKDVKTTL